MQSLLSEPSNTATILSVDCISVSQFFEVCLAFFAHDDNGQEEPAKVRNEVKVVVLTFCR